MEKNYIVNSADLLDFLKNNTIASPKDEARIESAAKDVVNQVEACAMDSHADSVRNFLKSFGQQLPDRPLDPDEVPYKDLQLASNLILEEAFEVFECFGDNGMTAFMNAMQRMYDGLLEKFNQQNNKPFPFKTKVEAIKELNDLEVVTHNLTAFCGYTGVYDKAFDETMWSNNSKGYATVESAQNDLDDIIEKYGISYAHIAQPVHDKEWYIIRRNSDDKILKGKSYTKANIQKFLNK